MKTATYVRGSERVSGSGALQRTYHLSPPLGGYSHVVVSAVTLPMGLGEETLIFGLDATGTVTVHGELPGSYKGGLSHEKALENAGYTIKTSPLTKEQKRHLYTLKAYLDDGVDPWAPVINDCLRKAGLLEGR